MCSIDNNDYTDVPDGKTWIHDAWSGDMAAAESYLPKGTPVEVVSYWFPRTARGRSETTRWSVFKSRQEPGSRSPVLELHAGPEQRARRTSASTATCSPSRGHTAEAGSRADPPSEPQSTVVLPSYFRKRESASSSLRLRSTAEWQQAWNEFSGGL